MIQGGDPLGTGTGGPGTSSATRSTRTSPSTVRTCWRWPTPGPGPTGRSSSSPSRRPRSSPASTRSSVRSSRAPTSCGDQPGPDRPRRPPGSGVVLESVVITDDGDAPGSVSGSVVDAPLFRATRRPYVNRPLADPPLIAGRRWGADLSRHPGRETYVSCVRCGRPACPDCLRSAAVGQQCVECVRGASKRAVRPGGIWRAGRHAGPVVTWTWSASTSSLYLADLARPAIGRQPGDGRSGRLRPAAVGVGTGQWYRPDHIGLHAPTGGLGIPDITSTCGR